LINNRSNLEIGDVLFSGVATIGRIAVIKEAPKNWNINENIYAVKPKHEIINAKYLAYILDSKNIVQEYSKKIVGSCVKRFPMVEMKKLKIPIPCPNNPKKSLEIQNQIVNILDKFDMLINSTSEGLLYEIELRKKQYEYYRDLLLNFPKNEGK